MNKDTRTRRIQKELIDWEKNCVDGVHAEPIGDDLFKWTATIQGPLGSPYEEGQFKLHIEFPYEYPFKPPKVYHLAQMND